MKSWTCLIAALVLGLTAPVAVSARDDHDRRAAEAHRGEAPRGGDRRGEERYAPSPQRPSAYGYYRPGYGGAPPPPTYAPRAPSYPNRPAYPGYPGYPGYRPPAYGGPRYDAQPGYGRWRRGQILPPAYRGEVVNDYGRYHLRRPPRGYYWCRQGDDFVLVAMTTGLIFEVISGGY
ncbi:MAG TPA: RcnB family protein [Caulobacteraceae bacterium]